MGKLIGWGLAIGGGYLLLDHLGLIPSTVPVATGVTTSPQAANPMSDATKGQLISALAADHITGYQSADLYGWYYQKVRGIAAPAPETLFVGADRNKLYSFDEWWSAMVGAGMSGMGIIAHRVNPYWNPIAGQPSFSNLSPNGSEKLVTRFN